MRMDPPRLEIYESAKRALTGETVRLQSEEETREKRRRLIGSMRGRSFWHRCEICGKKEFITAQDVYDPGWDYPPHMGHLGLLGPRTCGKCQLKDTLFWKPIQAERRPSYARVT